MEQNTNNKIPVLVLFGPTASGKTDVLLRLFGQDGIIGQTAEIVSADSMQVYKGMDIGTAKPTAGQIEQIPHHLIDICEPSEQFNAGDFVRHAFQAITGIAQRGKLPIVSGGTGFYLKNLIMGLPEAPPSDETIRAELKLELKEKGSAALMEELARFDPVSAQRIHINDEYRLLRALEVLRLCGQPLSSFNMAGTEKSPEQEQFHFIVTGLFRPRDELYRRIEARCAAMFSYGLKDEVKKLYNAGYTPDDPGMRAIGYREFFIQDPAQEPGNIYRLSEDMEGIQALIAQNSRRYAKRQITYFNSLPDKIRIMAGKTDEETAEITWQAMFGALDQFFNLPHTQYNDAAWAATIFTKENISALRKKAKTAKNCHS